MKPHAILGAVTTLTVTEPGGCDRAALAELACLVRQVRGWLDAVEASVATRAAQLSVPEVVAAGRASRDVRAVVGRGDVCEAMPSVHAALLTGSWRPVMLTRSPARSPGSTNRPVPRCSARPTPSSTSPPARRSTGSNVTSVTSPADWKATGSPPRNGCGDSGRRGAGPTATPARVTHI